MPIEAGIYQIKNGAAWTTIDESTDGKHEVHGWRQTNLPNQLWRVQPGAAGAYSLQNVASGAFLHTDGPYNRSKLVGSNTYSTWYLDQQRDGSVYIIFPGSNHVVDLDGGSANDGTDLTMSIENGRYQIKNAASWTVIDESTDGQRVVHGWTQTNQTNQFWQVERIMHNVYQIRNVGSGSYLSMNGFNNGSRLVGADSGHGWYLYQEADGSVVITYPADGVHVVDLDNGNPTDGAILWEKNDGAKQQRWFFEKV